MNAITRRIGMDPLATSDVRHVRPLCRRYSVVVFSTATTLLQDRQDNPQHRLGWAFGRLRSGEQEVLGVWADASEGGMVPWTVLAGLRSRGVEFVQIGIGPGFSMGAAFFGPVFPVAQAVDSVEQAIEAIAGLVPSRRRESAIREMRCAAGIGDDAKSELARFQQSSLCERYPEIARLWGEALARFEPIYTLPAQLRGLIRSADRAAAEVRAQLTRSIMRHGPFPNPEAALEFVASTLLRAEQRLDRERAVAAAARNTGAVPRNRARLMPAVLAETMSA